MPQVVNFNNRQVIEPGGYSRILGGSPAAAAISTYGNIMLIDTGLGKGFVGGSGIAGELASGGNAIYELTSREDAKDLMIGGVLWDLMDYLWSPAAGANGPRKVYFSRAATTTAPRVILSLNGGANIITLAYRNEGVGNNGVLTSGELTSGAACKLRAGSFNSAKFVLDFYQGRYKGNDGNGYEYESSTAILAAQKSVTKVASSAEVTRYSELINWMKTDANFNTYFAFISATNQTTDFNLSNADLTAVSGYQLFTGGTTVYNSARVDDVLQNIEELDCDQFLCTDYGSIPSVALTNQQISDGANQGAMSVNNTKILTYCVSQSVDTEKALYIGGGTKSTEFNNVTTNDGSIQIAQYYNHPLATVIHSGVKMIDATGTLRDFPAIYHAALVCGRVAGLEPQVPVTYKPLRISGLTHQLKKVEREQALLNGVLHTKHVPQLGWVVNQGVNSMQDNASLIYANGASPEISIMRIIHQINKELRLNATIRYAGGNLKTVDAEEIKNFTEGYLSSRTINQDTDNLLVSWKNVTPQYLNGKWNVRWCGEPNGPVNQIFFTGYLLDPQITV